MTDERVDLLVRNFVMYPLQMLLEWGANINAMDAWSQTPLFYSISSERSNMVELLLQFHCDTDIKDRQAEAACVLRHIFVQTPHLFHCSERKMKRIEQTYLLGFSQSMIDNSFTT